MKTGNKIMIILFICYCYMFNVIAQVPIEYDTISVSTDQTQRVVIKHHYFEVHDFFNIFDSRRIEEDEYGFDTSEAVADFRLERVFPFLIIGIVLSVLSILAIKYGKRQYPAKDNLLKNSADYIQKYRYTGLIRGRKKPILKFFVKDNKMGLVDVAHYCVFLPAKYDVLEWREKNKYLNATIGNRTFIIDINGNELK